MYVRVNLMNQLRKLWEQHVMWTRSFIISTASDLGDLDLVTKRLLENPSDFANILKLFYGNDIADQFESLFTDHLTIAADLVNAAKAGDTAKVESSRKKWYENADEIARFLHQINPNWDVEEWRSMLNSHLKMTEEEAVNRLTGNYAKDIELYNLIEEEALEMADTMALGMIRQFNL